MSVVFFGQGTFQGGSQILQNFEAWLLIKGAGVGSDRFRIFLGELGKKG